MSTQSLPRLGRYELLAVLGEGGMGRVLLARDTARARLRAVKVALPHLVKDSIVVAMLLEEGQIASRIRHPNVVAVREFGMHPTFGPYVVMDYIDGVALSSVLQRWQVPGSAAWSFTSRILLDVLAGLSATHTLADAAGNALGVVHRDVSPHNVLLSTRGVALLSDFGIARANQGAALTRTGQIKGKSAYMAPEQARGETLDARADLFAVGVMLWEALTLRKLARGGTEAERLLFMASGKFPRVRSVVPAVPEALDAVVARALHADPYLRFQSAEQMARSLRSAMSEAGGISSHEEVAGWLSHSFVNEFAERKQQLRAMCGREPDPWDEAETDVYDAADSNRSDDTVADAIPLVPKRKG